MKVTQLFCKICFILFLLGSSHQDSHQDDEYLSDYCELEEVGDIEFEPYEKMVGSLNANDLNAISGYKWEVSFFRFREGEEYSKAKRVFISSDSAFIIEWDGKKNLKSSMPIKEKQSLEQILIEFTEGYFYSSCYPSRKHHFYEYFTLRLNGQRVFEILSKNQKLSDLPDSNNTEVSTFFKHRNYLDEIMR